MQGIVCPSYSQFIWQHSCMCVHIPLEHNSSFFKQWILKFVIYLFIYFHKDVTYTPYVACAWLLYMGNKGITVT